ncbi:MAG TPA: outer membrane lipoprotein carrier protein LolA [Cytophagaceae bacterium]
MTIVKNGRRLKIRIFLLAIVLFFGYKMDVCSQPTGFTILKDTATLKKILIKEAVDTKTIQSDFIQEKNISALSEKIITKGKFYFKKESLLRWEYLEPFKYLIILNKNKVLIKDENKENKYDLQSNKMFQEINRMMINSVQGKILSAKEFTYSFYQNDKYYLLQLFPQAKTVKKYIKNIHLYFDKSTNGVSKIEMIENTGDDTKITFLNRKENVEISDEKFLIK